jgi:hypothetical protein
MKMIGKPYKSYYYLTDDNRVYNSLTKRYLRMNNNTYKLVNEQDKRINVTLKEIYYKVYGKIYSIDNIEPLEGEQWKEIDNSGGNYFISNMGRIKSYKGYNAKLLSQTTANNGYKRVNADFFGTGKTANFTVHRLVAEYFVEKPNKPMCDIVHHKDFNSLNNKSTNLCWISKEQHKEIHRKHDKEICGNEQ